MLLAGFLRNQLHVAFARPVSYETSYIGCLEPVSYETSYNMCRAVSIQSSSTVNMRIVAMHAGRVLELIVISSFLLANSFALADEPVASEKDSAIHVPTPAAIVDKMLEVAKVTKDDVLYDLGCGDGRIVIAAASKYGCHAVGYDIDERKVKESKENVKKHGVEKLVTIECQDIFKLDLKKANVITLFLLPEMNIQLIPQLDKMNAGSRVICHEFPFKDVQHDRKLTITTQPDGVPRDIYLYTLPLKKFTAK